MKEPLVSGPVVEPGPRRRPAEPQIVGSNPTRPAMFLRRGNVAEDKRQGESAMEFQRLQRRCQSVPGVVLASEQREDDLEGDT
jgi:hypothetical protein